MLSALADRCCSCVWNETLDLRILFCGAHRSAGIIAINFHGNHCWGCVMLSHMQCASMMTFPHALPLGCCRPVVDISSLQLSGAGSRTCCHQTRLASCSRAAAWTGFPFDVLLMSQALELFLSSRLALLCARLAAGAAAQGDSSGSSLAALLRELAALVQDTICQASGAAAIMMQFRPSSGMHNGPGSSNPGYGLCDAVSCDAKH